ncbi:PQQ-binding-like beta-propeller repeat protein [Vulgatibacter sp.]|uniref:outer membrane protein assembly factor BamB family protein n=1 Tax=Vulgatibacter sp. TaxID=1971226 RepID=UPI003561D1EF
MKVRIAPLLVACGLAAAACDGSPPEPQPAIEEPGTQPPVEEPAVLLQRDWVARGFGEVQLLQRVDLDGDGLDEVAVGARRAVALDGGAGEQRWFFEWEAAPSDPLHAYGDYAMVWEIEPVARADGGADLIVVDDRGKAWRVDGTDGSRQWAVEPDLRFPFGGPITVFGPEDERRFFPSYGYAAYGVATGEVAWESPLPTWPTWSLEARLAAGAPTGLFVAHQYDGSAEQRANGEHTGERGTEEPGLHAVTASGELLFSRAFTPGIQLMAIGVGDLAGTGLDAAVVAFDDGSVLAVDPSGETIWERSLAPFGGEPARTLVQALLAEDVDEDGSAEIFVVAHDAHYLGAPVVPYAVIALDADGAERWRYTYTQKVWQAAIERIGGKPVLVLAAGANDSHSKGDVRFLDLDPAASTRLLRKIEPTHVATSAAVVRHETGERLVVGSTDGILRSYDAASGDAGWDHHLTSFLYGVASVEGEAGTAGVVARDQAGSIAFHDSTGAKRWAHRLQVGPYGFATAATGGVIDGETLVLASSIGFAEDAPGHLEAFTLEGHRRFTTSYEGLPFDLVIGRFEGARIAALESMRAETDVCRLLLQDGGGAVVREIELVACSDGSLFVGDVDGDGRDEIAVHTWPAASGQPAYLALLASDGSIRWMIDEIDQLTEWVELVPGGLVHGGVLSGNRGFVLRRGLDGLRHWSTVLDPLADPLYPQGVGRAGTAVSAAVVDDLDEDGAAEIAVAAASNGLYLLDGATGEVRWETVTEDADRADHLRHEGGLLRFVAADGERPAHLLYAQDGGNAGLRSAVLAVSLGGEVIGTTPIDSVATAIVPVRGWSGTDGAVVSGLYSLYATSLQLDGKEGAE